MGNEITLMIYLLVGGKLERYILETTLDETLSESKEEFEKKVMEILYIKRPHLVGKSQFLEIEDLDVTIVD